MKELKTWVFENVITFFRSVFCKHKNAQIIYGVHETFFYCPDCATRQTIKKL